MKKAIITLTVVAGIIAAIALPVFAGTDADDSRSEEFPEAGIILNFTPEFEETKGVIVPYGGTDIGDGTGIYETDLIYFALDQDEFDRLSEDSFSEANYAMLVTIISADNGMTFEDIREDRRQVAVVIGLHGNFSFPTGCRRQAKLSANLPNGRHSLPSSGAA